MRCLSLWILFLLSFNSPAEMYKGAKNQYEFFVNKKKKGSATILAKQYLPAKGQYILDINAKLEIFGQTFETATEQALADDKFITPLKAQKIMAACLPLFKGKLEFIKLVGRNHLTCKIKVSKAAANHYLSEYGIELQTQADVQVWLGKFPITGLGKIQLLEGTLVLQSFKWN